MYGFRLLLLDELPEFGSRLLEVMRQPIEDKVVTTVITNAGPKYVGDLRENEP